MEFVPTAAMGALVFTLVNFLRFLTNKDWTSAITQLTSWVAGVVVTFLVAATDWANGIDVGGTALSVLNGSSLVFVGLMSSSIFGVVKNVIQGFDNQDSARMPPLVPPKTLEVPPHQ